MKTRIVPASELTDSLKAADYFPVDLEDFGAFQLKESGVTCYRQYKQGKPMKGKHAWQITVPYKSQGGARFKYADTAKEALAEARKWKEKGY